MLTHEQSAAILAKLDEIKNILQQAAKQAEQQHILWECVDDSDTVNEINWEKKDGIKKGDVLEQDYISNSGTWIKFKGATYLHDITKFKRVQ